MVRLSRRSAEDGGLLTRPPGTQIGNSLYERRVGGQVVSRDADALPRGPLSDFLQQAPPGQWVPASRANQSHGKDIRLQFVVPGEGTAQHFPPRLAQPCAGSVPAGDLAQQKGKRGV